MNLAEINKATLIWGPVSREGLDYLSKESSLVVVPEGRPYLLGLNYNIPLIKERSINLVYCTDNTLGLLFYQGKIKETILFYKKKQADGLIGICGSLYVALLSELHQVLVKSFPQGVCNWENIDKDASTLEARGFIMEENKEDYLIEPNDELIRFSEIALERNT